MNLIAIKDTVVYGASGTKRPVSKGQYVGVLKCNNNDGSYTLTSGEFVDESKVAVLVNNNSKIVSNPTNEPLTSQTVTPAQNRALIWKRIIAVSLLPAGVFAFWKGKKALGVIMIVMSLIMIKKNFKKP